MNALSTGYVNVTFNVFPGEDVDNLTEEKDAAAEGNEMVHFEEKDKMNENTLAKYALTPTLAQPKRNKYAFECISLWTDQQHRISISNQ